MWDRNALPETCVALGRTSIPKKKGKKNCFAFEYLITIKPVSIEATVYKYLLQFVLIRNAIIKKKIIICMFNVHV